MLTISMIVNVYQSVQNVGNLFDSARKSFQETRKI